MMLFILLYFPHKHLGIYFYNPVRYGPDVILSFKMEESSRTLVNLGQHAPVWHCDIPGTLFFKVLVT